MDGEGSDSEQAEAITDLGPNGGAGKSELQPDEPTGYIGAILRDIRKNSPNCGMQSVEVYDRAIQILLEDMKAVPPELPVKRKIEAGLPAEKLKILFSEQFLHRVIGSNRKIFEPVGGNLTDRATPQQPGQHGHKQGREKSKQEYRRQY
jgi:hypothetical protein